MDKGIEKILDKHRQLTHSETQKVTSHVQRRDGEWFINTLMIDGCEVPFKYKRQRQYKSLSGQCVNLTYYPATETIAGLEMEVMNVVRVKIS